MIELEPVQKFTVFDDLATRERIAGWLTKIAPSLPPSPLDERLEKALGYTPELYRLYIEHGVGRFMAGQIDADYFKKVTRSTIDHGLEGAWVDGMEHNGLVFPDDMTDEWSMTLAEMIQKEMGFLDGFVHAMQQGQERVKAGGSYNKELEQAMHRGELWARRYNDIRQRAIRITAASAKARKLASRRKAIRMAWRMGTTEKHCVNCKALHGIVAFQYEWEQSGYFPRVPNEKLECKGFYCDCTCEPTDLRRNVPRGLTIESWMNKRIERNKKLGKYDPEQPRAPEGSENGGQWITDDMFSRITETLMEEPRPKNEKTIEQIIKDNPVGDEYKHIGSIELTAYRTGDLIGRDDRGLFFGISREAAEPYVSLHANQPVKEYHIKTGNTIIAKNQHALYEQLFKKRLDVNDIDISHKFNSTPRALRWAEARISRTLAAKGYDSALLTQPFGPLPELWVFSKNSSRIAAKVARAQGLNKWTPAAAPEPASHA